MSHQRDRAEVSAISATTRFDPSASKEAAVATAAYTLLSNMVSTVPATIPFANRQACCCRSPRNTPLRSRRYRTPRARPVGPDGSTVTYNDVGVPIEMHLDAPDVANDQAHYTVTFAER